MVPISLYTVVLKRRIEVFKHCKIWATTPGVPVRMILTRIACPRYAPLGSPPRGTEVTLLCVLPRAERSECGVTSGPRRCAIQFAAKKLVQVSVRSAGASTQAALRPL